MTTFPSFSLVTMTKAHNANNRKGASTHTPATPGQPQQCECVISGGREREGKRVGFARNEWIDLLFRSLLSVTWRRVIYLGVATASHLSWDKGMIAFDILLVGLATL